MAVRVMKILYRVDASSLIGTGHLIEVVTIHQMLEQTLDFKALACINKSELARKRLSEFGITDIRSIQFGSEEDEIRKLDGMYRDAGIDVVILDLLDRSQNYYAAIRKIFRHSVVVLDNSGKIDVKADVCINFSIIHQPELYQDSSGTEYWIGPSFFPFSMAVREKAKQPKSPAAEVKTIFVTQGGTDPFRLTAKIVRALGKPFIGARVIVVVGGGFTADHYDELDRLRKGLSFSFEFHEDISQQKMVELMVESDMALAAAGNTLYELTALGVPTLVIGHHQRQDEVARAFEQAGAVRNLGIGKFLSEKRIRDAVLGLMADFPLRNILHRNCKQIFGENNMGLLVDKMAEFSSVLDQSQ